MVTQQNLDLLFQVRVLAGQLDLVMEFAVNRP